MLFMTEPVKLSSLDETDIINCSYCLKSQLSNYMYESLVSKPTEAEDDYCSLEHYIYRWEEQAYEWFKSEGYELSPDVMVSYMCDYSGETYGRQILSELNKHIPIINKLVKV